MKKLTIKLSEGRSIVEVVEVKNVDVDKMYKAIKEVVLSHLGDKKEEPETMPKIEDTDGDDVSRRYKDFKGLIERDAVGESVLEESNVHRPKQKKNSHAGVIAVGNGPSINVPDFVQALNDKFNGKSINDEEPAIMIDNKPLHIEKEEQNDTLFLVAKCPKCGKDKFFKTAEGKTFNCSCGESYPIENTIDIYGRCPNCSNNIGTTAQSNRMITLPGMNVSNVLHCKKCKTDIKMVHDKEKNQWDIQ